jgi:AcrR family transcriptional regulator
MAAIQPKQKRRKPARAASADPVSEKVVRHARAHFLSKGFQSVTMSEIAAELGVSKKTLYAHFASKRELLDAVIDSKITDVRQALEKLMAGPNEDLSSRLKALLQTLQTELAEPQEAFVRDLRREPAAYEKMENARRACIETYFGKLFEEGRKAGVVRKDISVRMMIEILLAAAQGIMNPSKLAELGTNPKSAFMCIMPVFLHGVMVHPSK